MSIATTEAEPGQAEWLRSLVTHAGIGLWQVDIDRARAEGLKAPIWFSDAVRAICRLPADLPLPATIRAWNACLHPDDVARTNDACMHTLSTGVPLDVRYRVGGADGSFRWMWSSGVLIREDDGRPGHICGTIRDIQAAVDADLDRTLLREASLEAELLRRSEQRMRTLLRNSAEVILIADRAGAITFESPAVETAWGHDPGAVRGLGLTGLTHPDDLPALEALSARIRGDSAGTGTIELRLLQGDGSWRHHEAVLTNLHDDPLIDGLMVTARDIEPRLALERGLTRRAFYDSLTGLPNRALLLDRLSQALARTARSGERVCVIFVDLVGFKRVNDSLGHEAGDQLLVRVAERLAGCGRAEDTVARLGGDEFVLVLECRDDPDAVARLANNVSRQFEGSFRLAGRDVFVSGSVGVAVGRSDGSNADTLLRQADLAMYHAKNGGDGGWCLFHPDMTGASLVRLELESDLRCALARGEFRLHYQPVVNIESGRITGFEALIRWQHPRRGRVQPLDFIPIAEETGLIVPIGRWVLEEGCRQMSEWRASLTDADDLVVSINLSARQFMQPDLDVQIAGILERTGLPARLLKLEITETTIMRDVSQAVAVLRRLREIGVGLAVDDFGTGYSSLAYLKLLPVDTIKIDRSFVSGIELGAEDQAIVRAVISLAASLSMSVTAEGVETAQQDRILEKLGCEQAQGFLYARPLEHDRAAQVLPGGAYRDGRAEPAEPAPARPGAPRATVEAEASPALAG